MHVGWQRHFYFHLSLVRTVSPHCVKYFEMAFVGIYLFEHSCCLMVRNVLFGRFYSVKDII